MYGWINACFEELITSQFGADNWEKIRVSAGSCFRSGEFIHGAHYDDQLTVRIVDAASMLLKISTEEILTQFGRYFVHFLEAKGFRNLLAGQARTMREWIQNINEPHRVLRGRFPDGHLPEFRVELDLMDPTGSTLLVHYYSNRRGGFAPIVIGVIQEIAHDYFSRELTVEHIRSDDDHGEMGYAHCTVWRISNLENNCSPKSGSVSPMAISPKNSLTDSPKRCPFHAAMTPIPSPNDDAWEDQVRRGVSVGTKSFKKIFPFHIIVNQQMRVIQVGNKLNDLLTKQDVNPLGKMIGSMFTLQVGSACRWDWHQLRQWKENVINIRFISTQVKWHFTGEVVILDDEGKSNAVAALLVSPSVSSISALSDFDMKLNDLPRHSFQRDMLHMEDQITSEIANTVRMTELTKQMEHERAKLQDALQLKRIFVRYVSHEVRTPLNIATLGLKYMDDVLSAEESKSASGQLGISGGSGGDGAGSRSHSLSSQSSMVSASPLREVLNDVQDSCSLAVDLLNDLLVYEKIDDGVFKINTSPIALYRILSEADKLFNLLSKGSCVTFAMDTRLTSSQLQTTVVEIDRSKFHQVIRNIFTNAIKFTPSKGTVLMKAEIFSAADDATDNGITFGTQPFQNSLRMSNFPFATNGKEDDGDDLTPLHSFAEDGPPSLSIGQDIDGPFVRLSFTDSGAGISVDQQKMLFQEFVQVKADKLLRGHGSGLGLWICMNIMHMHGGRIGVSSKGEGRGSTFVIDLPLSDAQPLSLPCSPKLCEREFLASLGVAPFPLTMRSRANSKSSNSSASYPHSSVASSPHQRSRLLATESPLTPTTPGSSTTPSSMISGLSLTFPWTPTGPAQRRRSRIRGFFASQAITSTKSSLPPPKQTASSPPPSLLLPLPPTSPSMQTSRMFPFDLPSESPLATCAVDDDGPMAMFTSSALKGIAESSPSASESPISLTVTLTYEERCRSCRVLVVDDAALNRKMVRRLLDRHFGSLDEAEDGHQAVEKYTAAWNKGEKYDVVLMDFMMPVMNGLDATKRICALDSAAVVIGVTGNGLEDDLHAFGLAGASTILLKPLRMELLEQALREAWNM